MKMADEIRMQANKLEIFESQGFRMHIAWVMMHRHMSAEILLTPKFLSIGQSAHFTLCGVPRVLFLLLSTLVDSMA